MSAKIQPLRRFQSTDKEMMQLQDNLKQGFDTLNKNPLLSSNIVKKANLIAGNNLVPHGLGRAYQSAFPALISGGGAGYGELYNVTADAITVSLPTAGSFVQLTQSHAGQSSGTKLTTGASGKITVNAAGTYAARFVADVLVASATSTYTVAVFVNGVQLANITQNTSNAAANDLRTVSLSGLHTFAAGDVVDVRFASNANADSIGVDTSNLSLSANAPTLSVTASPDPTQWVQVFATTPCVVDLLVT